MSKRDGMRVALVVVIILVALTALIAWVKAWTYCASFTIGEMPGICLILVAK